MKHFRFTGNTGSEFFVTATSEREAWMKAMKMTGETSEFNMRKNFRISLVGS
jgi:hypothetical protein